jgi:pre-mRNA-splicing factor ATP-dependent RNA helicase DHX15/PRP43
MDSVLLLVISANDPQDISPNYYDLSQFKKGDIKLALQRVSTKLQRKEADKGSRR